MGKIFKNMIPYWKPLILVLLLLFVQAWCDLSLPAYTSDIIDVGIQNQGIKHILPEALTPEEYEKAELLMTDEETASWEESYALNGSVYERNVTGEERLEELDDTFLVPLLMNYQMSAMEESTFKKLMAEQMHTDESALDGMTIEQIGASMGVELKTFEKETQNEDGNTTTVTCVDMRDLLQAMVSGGMLEKDQLLSMRGELNSMLDAMGSSLVKSMGVAYAAGCDAAAGVDVEAIQKSYLWKAGLKMVGMALIMGIATVLVGFIGARIGAGIGRDLRGKIFKRVVSFSNAEMDRFSTASLITRSTNDIQQIQMTCAILIRMVAYAPILGIGGILKVLQTGAGMGWIIVLAVLVILGYVMVLMAVAMPRFKLMQKLVDRINLVAREILTGLSVIRAFGREKKEEQRFDDANRDLTKTMLFTNRVMTFMMPGMMMIMNVLTVGIVWFGAHKIDQGTMQVGSMTAFITYAMMIVMAFLMLAAMSIMLPRAAVAAERIDEVIRTQSSIAEPMQPEKIKEHRGVICFSHVNFRYPNAQEDVLSDIDFVAEPGKTTAIIGSTGCGKSTLVNLIPRLYDTVRGTVKVDGVDVRNYPMQHLRDAIAMVLQKNTLFSGTMLDNLKWGDENASMTELEEVCKIACVDEFIDRLQDGYQTEMGQGVVNVSGGQKQRLCIARAILKKPKVLILDDSTSAVDTATESRIREGLAEKLPDMTKIIIAQRISSVRHADQIIILDGGRVSGIGTHESLLASNRIYQEIYESQKEGADL